MDTQSKPPVKESNARKLATADKLLRISELRYRRLFEAAQDGILLLNAKTAQIDDVNPFMIRMLGYTHEEFLGKKLWEIGAFKDTMLNKEAFDELQTKRRLAEIALEATARALRILSDSNIALLSSKTESVLLAEYCRLAVEVGGYAMAWIGVPEEDRDRSVTAIAHFGHEEGYLKSVSISWGDTPLGQGPTGAAIRTGLVQFVDDISADPRMTPWRSEAMRRGYRSSISLPLHLPDEIPACLTLYSKKIDIWSEPEKKILLQIAGDLSFGVAALRTAIVKSQYQAGLRASLEQTIQVLAATVEERDSYTAGHQGRVADLCSAISSELGLSEDRRHGLHLAASIHDLGKISIPVELLIKPRKLTAIEFAMIKEHPSIGFNIIKNVNFPWPIAKIIQQHHERIDGSGYPFGLQGNEILLEAKILAVADSVEAMASHRPYRAALGIEAALTEITDQSGIKYDAEVVDACLRIFHEKGYTFEST